MSALVADRLSFGWSPDDLLFSDISFTVGRERVGLVGRNGAGKSTLIRLLTGQGEPLGGRISRPERLLFLAQRADPALTIAEALGIAEKLSALRRVEAGSVAADDFGVIGTDWDLEERARQALRLSGAPDRPWDTPLAALSGGEAMRVRLARARLEQPDMLILDEPTNNLDRDGLHALYRLVEDWRAGLLVVSHDRTLLSEVDRILELSALGLKSYGGGFDLYKEVKATETDAAERRLADAEKSLKSARREAQDRKEKADRRASQGKRSLTGSIPKMALHANKQNAQASAGKGQSLGDQAIVEAQQGLDEARKDIEIHRPLAFGIVPCRIPERKQVLLAQGLTVRFDPECPPVIENISMAMFGPERVALTGRNGAGKSTLLKALVGLVPLEAGSVLVGVERMMFLRQDTIDDRSDMSLIDYALAANPDQTPNEARAALARFGFRNRAGEAPLKQLSGGERLRAALAVTLAAPEPPQLLILDEPTNHMDLESVETLEDALSAYDGALLVTSHDRWFLDAIGIDREVAL